MSKILCAAMFICALALTAAAQQPPAARQAEAQTTTAATADSGQERASADVVKLPATVSARYKQLQQQIEEIQRNAQQQVQLLQLMQQNALLEGMLELGLTKKQVESMVLTTEGNELVLKPKAQKAQVGSHPTENQPANSALKPD